MTRPTIDTATERRVHALHKAGRSQAQIAYQLGLSKGSVDRTLRRLREFMAGSRMSPYASGSPVTIANYTPTPEQIREECAKIRAGWTPTERLKRLVQKPEPVLLTILVQNERGAFTQQNEVIA